LLINRFFFHDNFSAILTFMEQKYKLRSF